MSSEEPPRLTSFSSGGGCGCKIAPKDLELILRNPDDQNEGAKPTTFPAGELLVGYNTRDDAAVMQIDEHGMCVVSTTDFFMPVVDDAEAFGRIAATNAISDIYAMGAKPCMAISILGWPDPSILCFDEARKVIQGARKTCAEAGIPLAGGHSIIAKEPIFGLAVTGIVHKDGIFTNGSNMMLGDQLFLTKPIGVGILSAAARRDPLPRESSDMDRLLSKAIHSMTRLNDIALELKSIPGVTAITDVTGFGLLGHLVEMVENAGPSVRARLNYSVIPFLDHEVKILAFQDGIITGGAKRNLASYGHKIACDVSNEKSDQIRALLADPQTSGGLLISVRPEMSLHIKERIGHILEKEFGINEPIQPIAEIESIDQSLEDVRIMIQTNE